MNINAAEKKMPTRAQCMISSVENQKGSVLIIALLILVAMTLGGITATKRSVTESFSVRNTAIHKQNLQLAEMAAMEGVGQLMIKDPEPDWLHSLGHDVNAPDHIQPLESMETEMMNALTHRHGDNSLAFYAITTGAEGSLTGDYIMKTAKVIGVYESDNYGRKTVEIGVRKRYIID